MRVQYEAVVSASDMSMKPSSDEPAGKSKDDSPKWSGEARKAWVVESTTTESPAVE
jgi:hypothetical protein